MDKNDSYVVNKILKWAEPKSNTGKTPPMGSYSPTKKVSGTQRKPS